MAKPLKPRRDPLEPINDAPEILAKRQAKSGRQRWIEKRRKRRYQLEIDEDIKDRIAELSEQHGVSQSQLVQYFLMTGLQDDASLSSYLEDSPAPMWKHRINFDKLRRDLGL